MYHTFIRSRQSIRKFQKKHVPRAVLRQILQTAIYAPSAHNRQPWRFVVLESQRSKQVLVDAMQQEYVKDLERDNVPMAEINLRLARSRRRILDAPIIIILCANMSVMDIYPDQKRNDAERIMAIQSVALAGENLLLAAHAEGLGAVWMCAPLFSAKVVQDALVLPGEWEPQALLLIGYPAEVPKTRARIPLEELVINR